METVPIPLNSEDFVPPAFCGHMAEDPKEPGKFTPDTEIMESQYWRERIVCAVGLDVHYDLDEPIRREGASSPKLKKFNPRFHSPACPENYTGKFGWRDEQRWAKRSNPIEYGKEVAKETPYDVGLYEQRDPRRETQTVVVREYMCKMGLEMANSEKLARAVLNNYSDSYVAFLTEFVSNTFGAGMRRYLKRLEDGYRAILQNDNALHNIMWKAYLAVRKGADRDDKSSEEDGADLSLPMEKANEEQIRQLSMVSSSLSLALKPYDYYDIRPCIERHIQTLKTMRQEYCRGFATKEVDALAMLYFCNEQGRKWTQDLQLLDDDGRQDFTKLKMAVPVLHTFTSDGLEPVEPSPIHRFERNYVGEPVAKRVRNVTNVVEVGEWSGSSEADLSTVQRAPFQWGWGHSANLTTMFHKKIRKDRDKNFSLFRGNDKDAKKKARKAKEMDAQQKKALDGEFQHRQKSKGKDLTTHLGFTAGSFSVKLQVGRPATMGGNLTAVKTFGKKHVEWVDSLVADFKAYAADAKKKGGEPEQSAVDADDLAAFTTAFRGLSSVLEIIEKNEKARAELVDGKPLHPKDGASAYGHMLVAPHIAQNVVQNLGDFKDVLDLHDTLIDRMQQDDPDFLSDASHYIVADGNLADAYAEYKKHVCDLYAVSYYDRRFVFVMLRWFMCLAFFELGKDRSFLLPYLRYKRNLDGDNLELQIRFDHATATSCRGTDYTVEAAGAPSRQTLVESLLSEGREEPLFGAAVVREEPALADPSTLHLARARAPSGPPGVHTAKCDEEKLSPFLHPIDCAAMVYSHPFLRNGATCFPLIDEHQMRIDDEYVAAFAKVDGLGDSGVRLLFSCNMPSKPEADGKKATALTEEDLKAGWRTPPQLHAPSMMSDPSAEYTSGLKTLSEAFQEDEGGHASQLFLLSHHLMYADTAKERSPEAAAALGELLRLRSVAQASMGPLGAAMVFHMSPSDIYRRSPDDDDVASDAAEPFTEAQVVGKVLEIVKARLRVLKDRSADAIFMDFARICVQMKLDEYTPKKVRNGERHVIPELYVSEREPLPFFQYAFDAASYNAAMASLSTMQDHLKSMKAARLFDDALEVARTTPAVLQSRKVREWLDFCRKQSDHASYPLRVLPRVYRSSAGGLNSASADHQATVFTDYPHAHDARDWSKVAIGKKEYEENVQHMRSVKTTHSSNANVFAVVHDFFDDDENVVLPFRDEAELNLSYEHPQFFAMLDAAAMLWNERAYENASESDDPTPEAACCAHAWVRTYVESFVCARENFKRDAAKEGYAYGYEEGVYRKPHAHFPPSTIGSMSDRSFKSYFPLLPSNHRLRDMLRNIRALDVMWGVTRARGRDSWMPLSYRHQMEVLTLAGLFDDKYHVPANPWPVHDSTGLSRVFKQSYHSPYHCDRYLDDNFVDWRDRVLPYQASRDGAHCYRSFSQYGGTPVEADFVRHRVDRDFPERERLAYNRFGYLGAHRIGQQYEDAGLIQDLFSYEYRSFAALSDAQRSATCSTVWVSNFLSYARNHAITALASCNHGTQDPSKSRIVRNLFRMFVDTYQCVGDRKLESIPVILGFERVQTASEDDRPVVLYAGTLPCVNAKLERFCASAANNGERVCAIYKQVYFNDAALLFNRKLRKIARKRQHDLNFLTSKRSISRAEFNEELIELQDFYIDFLQSTALGMLLESGQDLHNIPLQLLEGKSVHVPDREEDEDVLGNDFLTPRTIELVKRMNFDKDKLSRTQLAVLQMIPAHDRILSTYHINQEETKVQDLEHVRRQLVQNAARSNKNILTEFAQDLVAASVAKQHLEGKGVDLVTDFAQLPLKNLFEEANRVPSSVPLPGVASSTAKQTQRMRALRKDRSDTSVHRVEQQDSEEMLQQVHAKVQAMLDRGETNVDMALQRLGYPRHVCNMYRRRIGLPVRP